MNARKRFWLPAVVLSVVTAACTDGYTLPTPPAGLEPTLSLSADQCRLQAEHIHSLALAAAERLGADEIPPGTLLYDADPCTQDNIGILVRRQREVFRQQGPYRTRVARIREYISGTIEDRYVQWRAVRCTDGRSRVVNVGHQREICSTIIF